MRQLLAPLSTLCLRLLALAALFIAIFAPQLISLTHAPKLIVVLDRSRSVPGPAALSAWQDLRRQYPTAALSTLEFANHAAWLRTVQPSSGVPTDLDPDRTELAPALERAFGAAQSEGAAGMVLISDGHSRSDPATALGAIRAAAVPLCWMPVGGPPPSLRISSVQHPPSGLTGTPLTLQVALQSTIARRVSLSAQGSDGARAQVLADLPIGATTASLTYTPANAGPLHLTVWVRDEQGGGAAATASREILLDIQGPARTLYVGPADAPLAASLMRGGWPVEQVSPGRAPIGDAALERFGVIVLDNVAVRDAPDGFWSAVNRQVTERGTGLVVLGGAQSFAHGGYRHSQLESLLPVLSEPDAGEDTEAVAFVVDKSGSMGRSSSGVDRLNTARSAVIEAARDLSAQDQVMLVAFDVAPRVLAPLSSYQQARPILEAPWPIQAAGGTRVEPALQLAGAQLAAARSLRRTLVLVTDGYASEETAADISAMLTRNSIRLVILAIGADADLNALARLSSTAGTQLLRVTDVAQLPRFARAAIEAHRGRMQLGTTGVHERLPPPFLAADRWPALSGYMVTRARAEAEVFLVSDRDDPLLAAGIAGSGRVVVLPAGLGGWAREWQRAALWPQFAGALVQWSSRGAGDPRLSLQLAGEAADLSMQADLTDAQDWSTSGALSLNITTPSGVSLVRTAPAIAPGRYAATLSDAAPGLYTVSATAGPARTTRSFLHVRRTEADDYGINPRLRADVDAGLLQYCTSRSLQQMATANPDPATARRLLAAIALLGLLVALLIDYRLTWYRFFFHFRMARDGRNRAPRT